jgi:NADH dehydrogenase (ubiquinone) Fe-S protein 3
MTLNLNKKYIKTQKLFCVTVRAKTTIIGVKEIVPIMSYNVINNEQSITVSHKNLLFTLNVLKRHLNYKYNLLTCISGIDLLQDKYRFGVVYELLSLTYESRIRVKTLINEVTSVESSISLFKNANWWEREIWDLFGIYFHNHPDLRRILTDYGFEGYPLRKDFPLSGYVEVRYDHIKKRVVVDPIEFTQEFRMFQYETPWLSQNA